MSFLGTTLVLSGCSTAHYLFQATRGQLKIINRARPIADVLKDERTPPLIKRVLSEIPKIKSYGEKHGLKPTRNYEEYVHLDSGAASWVVTACRPLKFETKTWGFPIVGSFNYLGWFDLENANEFGEGLRAEGWDVDVRGAAAYSTLGWFRDPILSTMIPKSETAMGIVVNTVIHESIHATLYIPGQSSFNESIASFGADLLTPVYMKEVFGETSAETKAYLESEARGEERGQKLKAAYEKLDGLYKGSQSEEVKLAEKKKILDALKADLKFTRDINNATIVNFRTYGLGQEELRSLYRSCGQDWTKLWKALGTLRKESFPQEQMEDFGKVVAKLHC